MPVRLSIPDDVRNVEEPTVQELADSLVERRSIDAGPDGLAVDDLSRFLARHPESVAAWTARSQALAACGDKVGAANDLTRAIALTPKPEPDLYFERARKAQGEAQQDYDWLTAYPAERVGRSMLLYHVAE